MRRAPGRYRPPPGVRTVSRMDHDAAWKRLFALPCMVEHLLCGFAGPVGALLDLSTLRALPASWAGPDTEQRHSDAVWRVDYADGSGRSLVVVLELQSSVDRSMAVRVLRYASMACEAAMRRGETDADGEVRVLPVVVYSGRSRWTAPGAELAVGVTADGEVSIPLPHVYLSIDARRRARGWLPPRNLVSTLFELGVVEGPADVAGPMGALLEWLPGSGLPVEDVLSGFGQWLSVTLPRLFPGTGAGAVVEALRREWEGERGGRTMLAERVKEWGGGVAAPGRGKRPDRAAAATGDAQVRSVGGGAVLGVARRCGRPRASRRGRGLAHRVRCGLGPARADGAAARRRVVVHRSVHQPPSSRVVGEVSAHTHWSSVTSRRR